MAGTFALVISTAVVGGIFYAFSAFVMPALARMAPADGIRAMQSINITAVRAPLMIVFLGTALLAAVVAIARFGEPLIVAATALYLLGVIVVTVVANVPRNDALAKIDPDAATSEPLWRSYLGAWGAWNQVRWIASLASSAVFLSTLLI